MFLVVLLTANTLMLRSPGNGDQPVYVVTSERFDPALPVKVQTHYHGDGARALSGEHMPRIEELLALDAQRVFVLPEAAGNIGDVNTNWSNALDETRTTKDALAVLGVTQVESHTVSAHSAGGRALALALSRGTVRAGKLVLLDCLYEPAMTKIRQGIVEGTEVVIVRGTNLESRAQRFAEAFDTEPIVLPDHDATVRLALDGTL